MVDPYIQEYNKKARTRHYLMNYILEKGLLDGARIPSENQLTQKLKFSRGTVRHAIGEYDPVMKVKKVRGTKNPDSSYSVSITLRLPVRHYVGATISDLQEYVTECIEKYGGIMVKSTSIEIEEWG